MTALVVVAASFERTRWAIPHSCTGRHRPFQLLTHTCPTLVPTVVPNSELASCRTTQWPSRRVSVVVVAAAAAAAAAGWV